jgi:cytoskeleton protein RodZ
MIGGPGAQLSAARVQAGLSVSQAAEQLHLDLATLDALENGRFEGMGASVFVRGHLRRYAQLVNIPEAQIMTAYDAWAGRLAAQPDLRDVITAAAARSGSRRFNFRPRSAVIGVIVLVPLALIWWAVRVPAHRSEKAPAPAVNLPAVNPPPAADLPPAANSQAPADSRSPVDSRSAVTSLPATSLPVSKPPAPAGPAVPEAIPKAVRLPASPP